MSLLTPHRVCASLDDRPPQKASSALLAASRADISSREFQLEELEDKEECVSEVKLNDDGTVTLGSTSGPAFSGYVGDWHLLETASESDMPFRMRLTRTYEAVG